LARAAVFRATAADERLQGLLVDPVALVDVDGAPCVAFEAGSLTTRYSKPAGT
jgi:hypothetical protein